MSSDEKYWADRAIKREAYWKKQCREVIEKCLASQYNKTAQGIMKDIASLYGQFANENGLSIKEATALIRGKRSSGSGK